MFCQLALALTLMQLLFTVNIIAWGVLFKWAAAPALHYGMVYEKWSATWLRIEMVDDYWAMWAWRTLYLQNTQLAVWVWRLLGARIGQNVTMPCSGTSQMSAASLLAVGDDSLIEPQAIVNLIGCEDGMHYVCKHVTLHKGAAVLCRRAYVIVTCNLYIVVSSTRVSAHWLACLLFSEHVIARRKGAVLVGFTLLPAGSCYYCSTTTLLLLYYCYYYCYLLLQ